MENKKSLYIYYFIAVLMMFFPVINMFTFIPLVVVYKKYDFKRYINLAIFISILSLLTFRSFSSLMPFLISYVIINGIKKDKKGYEIIFLSSTLASFLSILDFSLIILDSKAYKELLDALNSNLSFLNVYNIDGLNFKKAIEMLSNFYPSITFFVFYVVLSFGYLILYKRLFRLENKKENIVTAINYKFILILGIIYVLFNIFKVNIYNDIFYKVYLLYVNVIIILFYMLTVEGFIAFNLYLKKSKKMTNLISNLVSLVSLFLIFSYVLYLLYGAYNSIIRGVKNEKNIN